MCVFSETERCCTPITFPMEDYASPARWMASAAHGLRAMRGCRLRPLTGCCWHGLGCPRGPRGEGLASKCWRSRPLRTVKQQPPTRLIAQRFRPTSKRWGPESPHSEQAPPNQTHRASTPASKTECAPPPLEPERQAIFPPNAPKRIPQPRRPLPCQDKHPKSRRPVVEPLRATVRGGIKRLY